MRGALASTLSTCDPFTTQRLNVRPAQCKYVCCWCFEMVGSVTVIRHAEYWSPPHDAERMGLANVMFLAKPAWEQTRERQSHTDHKYHPKTIDSKMASNLRKKSFQKKLQFLIVSRGIHDQTCFWRSLRGALFGETPCMFRVFCMLCDHVVSFWFVLTIHPSNQSGTAPRGSARKCSPATVPHAGITTMYVYTPWVQCLLDTCVLWRLVR